MGNVNIDTVINSAMNRKTASTPSRQSNVQISRGAAAIDTRKIEKAVMQTYRLDVSKDEADRIVDALQWLANTHPKVAVSIKLLYWMVFGGKTLKRSVEDEEIVRFRGRVSRARQRMIDTYNRTIQFCGNDTVRALVDAQEHAEIAYPKAFKGIAMATSKAKNLAGIIGDPNKLKLTADNKDAIDLARKSIPALDDITRKVRALLPQAVNVQAKK